MKSRTQKRPAERPETKPFHIEPATKVVSLRELRHVRELHQRRVPIQVPGDTYNEFESVAHCLKLPVDMLAGLVLDAFVEMVDEDHSVEFPLLLQQVTTS